MTTGLNRLIDFAFDRDPANRYYDSQGFLHVRVCNISKAVVNPYYGKEIPGYEALGLDPERVYQLYRHPDELAKAADTFNGLPLFDVHRGTSADDHPKNITVGCTGSEAAFKAPYLQNALAIWTAEAIAGVESGQITQLSCGYAYTPDMTPGVERGLVFDGVMRNLKGNHVALVEAGRAGPDVLVADSKLEMPSMSKREERLKEALKGKLAADASINYAAIILALDEEKDDDEDEAKRKATEDKKAKDARRKARDARRKARDEKCAADERSEAMDAEEDRDDAEEAEDEDMDDPESMDRKKARDMRAKDRKARDEKRAKDRKGMDKSAMDAAIAEGVAKGVAAGLAARDAMDEARRLVKPHVGELTQAFDSAADIYKFALDAKGVDLTDTPPVAFKALVKNLSTGPDKPIALDSKSRDEVADLFPGLARYA